MNKIGKVYLVGAGPGDGELLTLKAQRLLESAEVVVYDRLVSEEIMGKIPPTAIKINVGKNVGNHPVPQEEINQILCDQAKKGHNVVRLKGGDSFLFGRGGEELELLCENGVSFEVVPGITSAMAAATYAGIPVTHRDFCSSLHIITGHKKKDGALNLDYDSLVKLNGTLVFMMSVASVGEIAVGLMKNGMMADMDCAVIENGTRPNQRKFVSTIGEIAEVVKQNEVKSPSVIIVGRVCSLSNQFDWFSQLPLKGKKILVTRPKATSGRLASELKQMGAEVLQLPAIKTTSIPFAMPDLAVYSTLVFTSGVGVTSFFDALFATGRDARALFGKRIAVVGKETAKMLLAYGITADFIPAVYSGEALAKELLINKLVTKSDLLLILSPKKSSPGLTDILKENKISFDKLAVYETQYQSMVDIDLNEIDIVTFTSGSCVEGFVNSVGLSQDFSRINALCIGEQTAAEAKKYNMKITLSKEATIPSMIERIGEMTNDK